MNDSASEWIESLNEWMNEWPVLSCRQGEKNCGMYSQHSTSLWWQPCLVARRFSILYSLFVGGRGIAPKRASIIDMTWTARWDVASIITIYKIEFTRFSHHKTPFIHSNMRVSLSFALNIKKIFYRFPKSDNSYASYKLLIIKDISGTGRISRLFYLISPIPTISLFTIAGLPIITSWRPIILWCTISTIRISCSQFIYQYRKFYSLPVPGHGTINKR